MDPCDPGDRPEKYASPPGSATNTRTSSVSVLFQPKQGGYADPGEVAVEDCELQAFGTYSRHGVIGPGARESTLEDDGLGRGWRLGQLERSEIVLFFEGYSHPGP